MKSFVFWQKWLFYTSLLFALSAIIFSVSGTGFLFGPYNELLARIFWNRENFPAEAERFHGFACGPIGATMACCYIMLAFIARYPFANKERWSRNAIALAFGTWFIIDSAVCWYYGIYSQVIIINSFSVLVKALPLIFTWREFKK